MTAETKSRYDLVIVGAGFAGMYMLHKAREQGLDALVVEGAAEVGGCWYSTRYPGLRCDIESMQYSYSFCEEIQQEWEWPDLYSRQEDILRYAQFVADKLDLRRDILFNTRVLAAHWNEERREWTTRLDNGGEVAGAFVILCTGSLSRPVLPEIPGIESFAGELFHTSAWPKDVQEFGGRKVGIVGTGSSGVQIAAEAAKTAQSLVVIQRTVPYVLELRNREMDPGYAAEIKRNYRGFRKRAQFERAAVIAGFLQRRSLWDLSEAEAEAEMERCWEIGNAILSRTFTDTMIDRTANDRVAEFVRQKIRSTVRNPEKLHKVLPTTRYGAKRLAISTGYYEIFNQDNVDAIRLDETPIIEVLPDGIRTSAGHIPLDTLILATGYDAGTGPLKQIDIVGRDGVRMVDALANDARLYLGLMAPGFPNMFVVTGPGSPGVLSNVIMAIEQHVEWIADCLSYMRAHAVTQIDADVQATREWADHVDSLAGQTVFMDIDTWYNGGNVPGKKKAFMFYAGGWPAYSHTLATVVNDEYRGFLMQRA